MKYDREKRTTVDDIRLAIGNADLTPHQVACWPGPQGRRMSLGNGAQPDPSPQDPNNDEPVLIEGVTTATPIAEGARGWVAHYATLIGGMIARSAVSCRVRHDQDASITIITLMFEADDGDSFPLEIQVTGVTRHYVGSGWAEVNDIESGVSLMDHLLDRISADASSARPHR